MLLEAFRTVGMVDMLNASLPVTLLAPTDTVLQALDPVVWQGNLF
jgi:hypothetical protein